MIRTFLKKISKITLGLSLALLFLPLGAICQAGQTTATSATPDAAKSPSPTEEYQTKLGQLTKKPAEFIPALGEFVNKFPYSERATSYYYNLKTVIKNTKDTNEARSLLNQLAAGTENISPASVKVETYRHIGEALFSIGFYEDAAALAQKAIDAFDEAAYLDFKRKQSEFFTAEYTVKNPNYKPRPFDTERMRSFYVGQKTNAYNLLAKSLWEQGKFEGAEKAYRASLAVKVSKESALGIARAAEKNGKDSDALKYATVAALTGKLVPAEMEYFYSVYAKRNKGKTNGVEKYLDKEYKKTYRNPIKGEKYKRTDKRSDRVVLAEFVTGAGCVPCIPLDYTFENVLHDFSRKEVVVLSFHWHAPTMDPLGNHSADSRVKYYEIRGAPTLFIDGKKFEKEGDYNGGDGEQSELQPVADNLYATLKANLEIPAEANLKLEAQRKGQKVSVTAQADQFKNASDDVTLHIALIEKEATYSGENGLRFHFMVVRALAGDEEKRIYGFKAEAGKPQTVEYVFDVDKVTAQNLAYYDIQSAERMKEFLGRMGGKMPEGLNIDFKFNYKRHQINSDHLSVVAYLQDNKTKKILQSAYLNLGK
jgi:tetratricopeptide (TPR) repeat protein